MILRRKRCTALPTRRDYFAYWRIRNNMYLSIHLNPYTQIFFFCFAHSIAVVVDAARICLFGAFTRCTELPCLFADITNCRIHVEARFPSVFFLLLILSASASKLWSYVSNDIIYWIFILISAAPGATQTKHNCIVIPCFSGARIAFKSCGLKSPWNIFHSAVCLQPIGDYISTSKFPCGWGSCASMARHGMAPIQLTLHEKLCISNKSVDISGYCCYLLVLSHAWIGALY